MATDGEGGQLVWRVLIALGVISFLAGFVWLWWHWIPILYEGFNGIQQSERLKAITDTRTALLAGLIGLGALGTLLLNLRGQGFTEETLRVSQETYRLSVDSQLTERYAKAVEQLSDDKLDLRLGGIYALERLAVDSERDHPTVVEVLSAFVRERTDPTRTEKPSVAEVLQQIIRRSEQDVAKAATGDNPERAASRPKADVLAALAVLGRLPARKDVVRLDLVGMDLRFVPFVTRDLTEARLTKANLEGVNFDGVDLTNADLSAANLDSASFLGKAKLVGTSLTRARLSRARLPEADLSGADLALSDLSDADLADATLTYAVLSLARLRGTNLSGVDLSEVEGLSQRQLDEAFGNARTVLPQGLIRPATWA